MPYRLEMGSRLAVGDSKNLYEYWGARLHDQLDFTQGPVINMASVEYAKAIRPFLTPDESMIDIIFGRMVDGKFKTRATQAKIARGSMARYAAMNGLTQPEQLKAFDHPHYHYSPIRSTASEMVFEYHD